MSKPIGSICCDNTVTLLQFVQTNPQTQEVEDYYEFDLFQCDECGSVSKECNL